MKKILSALFVVSVFTLPLIAQSTTKIERPRVVKKKAPTPTPTPESVTSPAPAPPPPPLIVDDEEELKIETNLVTLPVSVFSRDGKFIDGLAEKDFDIYEDGEKQEIEYFASLEKPFTVVLLIDVSPSTKYRIDEIQDAAISFVGELRPQDQVVVASFSNELTILSRNKRSYHRIRRDIRKAKFGVGTSLYASIDYTIENLLNPIEGRKALVLFSDGVDTSSVGAYLSKTVEKIERTDTLVYPIRYNTYDKEFANKPKDYVYPVGSSPQEYARGRSFLRRISNLSGGRFYEAENTANLTDAFKNIAEELRRQYFIGYYPQKEGKAGERKNIKVLVKKPDLEVRTKNSYIVKSGPTKGVE